MSMKERVLNPYIGGILVGILAILVVYLTTVLIGDTKFFGTSTTFVKMAGLIEKFFVHDLSNQYYEKVKLTIDWQFMFVIGIFLGALISSILSGSFRIELVPPIFRERFGNNFILRAVFAFVGGFFVAFGARLADGCPSGHGLSGMMQLSLGSLLAVIVFFSSAIIFANLIYRSRR
ncbi:MAG: YeeE/YedE family protein [bacterium]|nr:YeeE/YedE family protein [bacterium]